MMNFHLSEDFLIEKGEIIENIPYQIYFLATQKTLSSDFWDTFVAVVCLAMLHSLQDLSSPTRN